MAKNKIISEEVISKYLDNFFKIRYDVVEGKQPNFWEAVRILCNDTEADVSHLLNEENMYCLRSSLGIQSCYTVNMSKSVLEFALYIANSIRESEARTTTNVDLFILEEKMKKIEEKVRLLGGYSGIY